MEYRYVEGKQCDHDAELAERIANGWEIIGASGRWLGYCLTLIGRLGD